MVYPCSIHVLFMFLLPVFFSQGNGVANPYKVDVPLKHCEFAVEPNERSSDFDGSIGRWETISIDGKMLKWTAVGNVTSENGNTIPTDWTMITRQNAGGSFMNLDVSTNIKNGATAQLGVKLTSVPPNRATCIHFALATFADGDNVPSLTLFRQKYGGQKQKLGEIQVDSKGEWLSNTFQTCVGEKDYILFESTKMSKNTLIGIDSVYFKQSKMASCPPSTPEKKPEENPKSTAAAVTTTINDVSEPANEASSNKDDEDDEDDEGGLSEGSKITLIVICLLVTLVIVVLIACVIRRKCCNKESRESGDKKKSDKYKDYKMEQVVTNE